MTSTTDVCVTERFGYRHLYPEGLQLARMLEVTLAHEELVQQCWRANSRARVEKSSPVESITASLNPVFPSPPSDSLLSLSLSFPAFQRISCFWLSRHPLSAQSFPEGSGPWRQRTRQGWPIMQACSRLYITTARAEPLAPSAYLRPIKLPNQQCFVSRTSREIFPFALSARSRARFVVSAAAISATANPLAVLGSASGDVFVAGTDYCWRCCRAGTPKILCRDLYRVYLCVMCPCS